MTFRTRLTATLAALGIGVMLCVTAIYYYQVRGALRQTLDEALKSVARAELASALDDPDEELHVHDTSEGVEYPNLETGLEQVAWIVDAGGVVVAHSENISTARIAEAMSELKSLNSSEILLNLDLGGRPYRLLATGLEVKGEHYLEVLGLSREPLLARLALIEREIILLLMISMVLIPLLSSALSRRLTKPLEVLVQQVESIEGTAAKGLVKPHDSVDQEIELLYSSIDEMLKRLDEGLEQQKRFLSDASHELRAPLTNLRVALEVCLRKERAQEEYVEVLGVCQQEVVRLGALAERLLTLNRIDSGLYELQFQSVLVSPLVNEAVETFRPRAGSLGVGLSVTGEGDKAVPCDPGALRQVLDNLLDNALRHAPRGSTVELALAGVEEGVQVSVSNAGCNLSPEQLQKVFEPFYRVDASRQRETGGAGLGLAIAKGFVEGHGGRIWVENGPETRVSFCFSLPYGE